MLDLCLGLPIAPLQMFCSASAPAEFSSISFSFEWRLGSVKRVAFLLTRSSTYKLFFHSATTYGFLDCKELRSWSITSLSENEYTVNPNNALVNLRILLCHGTLAKMEGISMGFLKWTYEKACFGSPDSITRWKRLLIKILHIGVQG